MTNIEVAGLKKFVKKKGSQEAAAHEIGVSFKTINRWLKGHAEPTHLSRIRLHDLGVFQKV